MQGIQSEKNCVLKDAPSDLLRDGQVRPLVKGEMLFCLCKENPFFCLVIMILGSLGSQQSAKTHVGRVNMRLGFELGMGSQIWAQECQEEGGSSWKGTGMNSLKRWSPWLIFA